MKGKLRWYYGCMSSSKTATLLMKAHQFEQCGMRTILLKHIFDTRDRGVIRSRAIKDERRCFVFDDSSNLYLMLSGIIECWNTTGGHSLNDSSTNTVVFVDEIQFARPEHIEQLWSFSKDYNIDVYCFGLKTKASNELFDSAPNLMIYADHIEEIKSMCSRCTNKATTHLLFVDNIPVTKYHNSLSVGDTKGDIHYESLCQCCRKRIVENTIE